MKWFAPTGFVILGLLLAACSDSKCKCGNWGEAGGASAEGGASNPDSNGTAGETAAVPDACHDGCVETLAANCDNGPADQATCESDCHKLEAGKCGAEYATLQTCAKGKALTCSAQGLPSVADCSDEQTAFVACLNG
jgi:hypothetical protein